jgi:hypothetical protein
LTQDEAAGRLGWAPGVLRGRLDRGRERLRRGLLRRGVTVAGGLLAALLDQGTAAAVPPALETSTVAAALDGSPDVLGGQAAHGLEVVGKAAPWARWEIGLVAAPLAALVLVVGALALFLARGPERFGSASSTLPKLELDTELEREGVRCEEVGRSSDVSVSPFGQKEEHCIRVLVTAGKQPLRQDALSYTLYGDNRERLSTAKVQLPRPVPSGGRAEAAIRDVAIGKARRLVIHP